MPGPFWEYYAYFLISTVLFTGLGCGLLWLLDRLPQRPYAALFASGLTGVTVFVFAVSVYATRGLTVNLALLPLAALIWWNSGKDAGNLNPGKDRSFPISALLKAGAEVLPVSFLLFGFIFWLTNGFGGFGAVRSDEAFYAKLSHNLWQSGIESYNLEVIYPETNSVSPYHYFELWLTAGLSALFSINNFFCLVVVVATLVPVMFYQGVCAVFERMGSLKFYHKAVALLLIFTSGLYFPFFLKLPVIARSGFLQNSLFHNPKFSITYLFLLAAALAYLYRNYRTSGLLLLVLPVVSILTAPGILTGLVLFTVGLLVFRKETKTARLVLFSTLLIAFFFAGFYLLQKPAASMHESSLVQAIQETMLRHPVAKLRLIAETVVMTGVLYALYFGFLACFIPFRKIGSLLREQPWVLLAGLVFGGSLLTWALLRGTTDAFQLFLGISIPMLNVLCILFLARTLALQKHKIAMACFLAVVTGFALKELLKTAKVRPEPANPYFADVLAATRHLNPVGAFIRGKADYWTIYTMNTNTYALGDYLVLNSPRHHTIGLSVFDIPLDPKKPKLAAKKQMVAQTSFYHFVQEQKEKGVFQNIAQSQLDFILEFKIRYLLVSKSGALPALLQPEVKRIITDQVSGERCYLLK